MAGVLLGVLADQVQAGPEELEQGPDALSPRGPGDDHRHRRGQVLSQVGEPGQPEVPVPLGAQRLEVGGHRRRSGPLAPVQVAVEVLLAEPVEVGHRRDALGGHLGGDEEVPAEVEEVLGPGLVAEQRVVGGEHQVPVLGGQGGDQAAAVGPERLDQGVIGVTHEHRQLVGRQPEGLVGLDAGEAGVDAQRVGAVDPAQPNPISRPTELGVEGADVVAVDLGDEGRQRRWNLGSHDQVVEGQRPADVGHPCPDVDPAPTANGALPAPSAGAGAAAVGTVAVAPRADRLGRRRVGDEERADAAVTGWRRGEHAQQPHRRPPVSIPALLDHTRPSTEPRPTTPTTSAPWAQLR